MHAVIVDTTLTTPPTGGGQTFLIELCRAFTQMSWRMSVVTQPGPEGAVVTSLEKVGAEMHDNIWRRADLPEERGRALAAWVNSESPDVYVISISPDAGWLALPSLDPSIPTVSIAHNDVSAFYEPLKYYHLFIDAAVGVSETIHRKIIEQCGIPSERATHIPYGVNSLTLEQVSEVLAQRRKRDALRICYVGRLVQEQKRVLEFVPLAAELERRDVPFDLHLIGDGSERKSLESQFRDQGLEHRVTLWGWLTPREITAKLLELDVFVLLSDHEGLPVALLEAMAHGLLGENPDLLLRMRTAAWQTSQKFSSAKMVDRYLFCFAEAKMKTRVRGYRAGVSCAYPPMPSCRSKYPLWLRKLKARLLSNSLSLQERSML